MLILLLLVTNYLIIYHIGLSALANKGTLDEKDEIIKILITIFVIANFFIFLTCSIKFSIITHLMNYIILIGTIKIFKKKEKTINNAIEKNLKLLDFIANLHTKHPLIITTISIISLIILGK